MKFYQQIVNPWSDIPLDKGDPSLRNLNYLISEGNSRIEPKVVLLLLEYTAEAVLGCKG